MVWNGHIHKLIRLRGPRNLYSIWLNKYCNHPNWNCENLQNVSTTHRPQARIRLIVQYLATGHDKSEKPLVRFNPERRLSHLDDVRRITVAGTRRKRSLVVIGEKDTLKYGYEGGLCSFIRNVYACGLVIEMPFDQWGAAVCFRGDAKKLIVDLHEARSMAVTIDVQKSTWRKVEKSGGLHARGACRHQPNEWEEISTCI